MSASTCSPQPRSNSVWEGEAALKYKVNMWAIEAAKGRRECTNWVLWGGALCTSSTLQAEVLIAASWISAEPPFEGFEGDTTLHGAHCLTLVRQADSVNMRGQHVRPIFRNDSAED